MPEEIPPDGLSDEEIKSIPSEYKRIAVVGFSRFPPEARPPSPKISN